jgi:hypothetical protein
MKSRLLILFALVGVAFLITFTLNSEAMRVNWTLDQMIERSDVIVLGTVQSTWVDIRPFDEQKIVDTAKIRVDEWLKNEKNSNTIEIRYYGHWAQTIENLVGFHRMDVPTHRYETGQRVLVPLSHEDSTMVMGEGYYPFFEGKFVINDDVAISQSGKQMKLTELYDVIRNSAVGELDSGWITDEDYCQEWCDNDELYQIGCDQPILAHLAKYSNLLDEEFNGKYAIEDIGLPDGVTKEQFEECEDFILEQRTTVELENENIESERKILECYGIFNCNVSSQYFESCIGAKKNGVTIEQLCSDSDTTIDNGCATIEFPDSTKTVSCHYED